VSRDEVQAEPGVDAGVQHGVDEHVGVSALGSTVAEERPVRAHDVACGAWSADGTAEQVALARERGEHDEGGGGDGEEEPAPAKGGLEQRTEAGAEGGAAGHGAEWPAERVAAALVLEAVADESEGDGDDAAGADRRDDAGGDEWSCVAG